MWPAERYPIVHLSRIGIDLAVRADDHRSWFNRPDVTHLVYRSHHRQWSSAVPAYESESEGPIYVHVEEVLWSE